MTELSPELQGELVEFVRYAGKSNAEDCTFCRQARKLAAKLPKPVDPDIDEARKLAVADVPECAVEIMAGEWDSSPGIGARLAGIRRGRELERSGK